MQDESAADAAAWWAHVERRCAEVRAELREMSRKRHTREGVDVGRWRRGARLGLLPGLLPGFAALWKGVVPAEHLREGGAAVECVCGSRVELLERRLAECDGGCGRWFLRTDVDVRVARFGAEAAA